jgi:hypothetical protein
VPYASVQAIREGAGLLSRSENETPAGAINGSNKDFTVKRRPIVDGNDDGTVDASDVQAYVNGVSVTVSGVNATTGVITLQSAPANGTQVTVTYHFSPLSDSYVEAKADQASSWIDGKIKRAKLDKPPTLPLNTVPGVITSAAELYAAGLILTRDWGGRADTEQTSKDGFAKIRLARELVDDYIAGLEAEENNVETDASDRRQMSAVSDGDIFDREIPEDCYDADEYFWRRKTL